MKVDLKVAHVIERDTRRFLAFSKATATRIPWSVLLGSQCRIYRSGTEHFTDADFRGSGILAAGLKAGDRVEIRTRSDLYADLFTANEREPGVLFWIDPDLEKMLARSYSAAMVA